MMPIIIRQYHPIISYLFHLFVSYVGFMTLFSLIMASSVKPGFSYDLIQYKKIDIKLAKDKI